MSDGNNTGTISIAGDFQPLERGALESINKVQRLFNSKLGSSSLGLTRPLNDASVAAQEFTKSMAAANARVIAFGAAAGIIFQVSKAIQELASSTIEVDKALTDLNVLLGKSRQNLTAYGSELFKIAKDTGQSFSNIADGAQELARQGLGAEDTLLRLRDAAILSRQSGLSLADSVETLTSTINSFSKAALTSTEIVNKFANVDAAFAVSSKDLAEGIKRVGSSAMSPKPSSTARTGRSRSFRLRRIRKRNSSKTSWPNSRPANAARHRSRTRVTSSKAPSPSPFIQSPHRQIIQGQSLCQPSM